MTKPITVTWLLQGRLLRNLGDKVLIVVLIVATGIGLTWLDSWAIRPGRELELHDNPGSGVTVRAEVLHLWLPQTLIDLARNQSMSLVALTHQESRTSLERRGQDLWYALTTRSHQVNGRVADVTFIRHPYRDPQFFQEFLDVLTTAAGNPPFYSASDYSGAEVHILSAELSEREPREVVEELLSLRRPLSERSQGSSFGNRGTAIPKRW
ncbi:MAG: hypothetical protein ACHRXM_24905 [Isosphaerales bacterium]